MLTVFVGAQDARAQAAQKVIAAEIKKGKQVASFSDASFQKESVLSYVSGADMFGGAYVVHLSRVTDHADGPTFFLEHTSELIASPTMYIVEENELSKELETLFEKLNIDVALFKIAKPNFFSQLTPFTLVDAYNARDKKMSWMLLAKLFANGTSAEEIAGAMMWNFKNLSLYFSQPKPTATSLDMKPFVFGKVMAAAKHFSQKEIADRAYELSVTLHKSHRGEGDGATLLELFILKSL